MQDGDEERRVNFPLENAQICAPTPADPGPDMNLDRMLRLRLISRFLPSLVAACVSVCLNLDCSLIGVNDVVKCHVLVKLCPLQSFGLVDIANHLTVACRLRSPAQL